MRDEKTTHAKTMVSHYSEVANSQCVPGHITSHTTALKEDLHRVTSHQAFQISFTTKCSHTPTRHLDNTVSAKFKRLRSGL